MYLTDKTEKSMQEAVVGLVQGLLDDKDTVSIGTAIIGHISGIAHLPIDTSSFPNGLITYTYHDFTRKQDIIQHFYPQHMAGVVSLSDFNITDEVQGVLYQSIPREPSNTAEITMHSDALKWLAKSHRQRPAMMQK